MVNEIAVRGWGIAELARRAKIGRPTVYGWRDSPRKPQSGPVNAVADVLGVDRRRANELAGIIRRAEPEPEPAIPQSLLRDIRNTPGLTEEQRQAVIAAIEKTLRGEPLLAPAPEPERRRTAS